MPGLADVLASGGVPGEECRNGLGDHMAAFGLAWRSFPAHGCLELAVPDQPGEEVFGRQLSVAVDD